MVAIPAGTSRLVNVERETWGLCLRTKENEMPKGVPSAGFRKTKNASVRVEKIRSLLNSTSTLSSETDEEIEQEFIRAFTGQGDQNDKDKLLRMMFGLR